jgi:hypothetical protein
MVVDTFPHFQDESWLDDRRSRCSLQSLFLHDDLIQCFAVFFWKRAQILVAEIWAAFYPASSSQKHPLFPEATINDLTMFADYRVPQILHHLQILTYPLSLVHKLSDGVPLAAGEKEELSIRAASIVAVEQIRDEIVRLGGKGVSSVLIDFYLWDLAKRVEAGEEKIDGVSTTKIIPAHRTRSIWY